MRMRTERPHGVAAVWALAIGLSLCVCGGALAETAASVFAAAETHYQKGEYESALSGYRSVMTQFPNDWRAGQARFTEAFILQKKLKKLPEARQTFEKVAQRETSGSATATNLANQALYHIASVDEQSGDTDKAIKSYTDYLAQAKDHVREKGARRKLDFLKRRAHDPKEIPPGWAHALKKRWYRRVMRDLEKN